MLQKTIRAYTNTRFDMQKLLWGVLAGCNRDGIFPTTLTCGKPPEDTDQLLLTLEFTCKNSVEAGVVEDFYLEEIFNRQSRSNPVVAMCNIFHWTQEEENAPHH